MGVLTFGLLAACSLSDAQHHPAPLARCHHTYLSSLLIFLVFVVVCFGGFFLPQEHILFVLLNKGIHSVSVQFIDLSEGDPEEEVLSNVIHSVLLVL